MARPDPHSYADDGQPAVRRLDLRARVDFSAQVLHAQATLSFDPLSTSASLDLDTRDLAVEGVSLPDGTAVRYTVDRPEPILGARLRLELPAGAMAATIRYATSPTASALQWLAPAQTAGKRHPFLFSQCQAIHGRSVVPLQDTPRRRIRYRAEIDVPADLCAVMSAASMGRRDAGSGRAVFGFDMPQPIPPYLLALAVGDLESRELGPRSRVWAEPDVVERAAWEFASVDDMLRTAEGLFGPYEWDRFDILTMPPSFPYGGMENPRLAFLTPTLLAGDRSLVNVLAHELAHSWTGNLVTNADAEHFWLNEGMTVFAERRIQEALEGPDVTALHAAVGRRALDRAMARFADRPELTRLRTQLAGVDPDETFSEVPYEKGYLFLRALEEAAGRARFDIFLKKYIDTFRFGTITSEEFAAFTRRELSGAFEAVDGDAWLFAPGVPRGAPEPRAARLEALMALVPPASGEAPHLPSAGQGAAFSPTEWQVYLGNLPRPAGTDLCRALDDRFGLSALRNADVLASWLDVALTAGHDAAVAPAERLLAEVGRMKYLRPLYLALASRPETRARARALYDRCRDRYHPIARQVVEGVLRDQDA
jgi:leukotriene-A4 hydrolase